MVTQATERRITRRLLRDAGRSEAQFQRELRRVFTLLGLHVSETAARLYEAGELDSTEPEDNAEAIIVAALLTVTVLPFLLSAFQNHYTRIYDRVERATPGLGLSRNAALEAASNRVNLMDLDGQTRKQLVRVLRDNPRVATDRLIREIQRVVPRGPYRDPTYRAKLIARTETHYAQNTAVIDKYENDNRVPFLLAHDALLGPTDQECEDRDGLVYSFAEARQLAMDEHPNGTLAFTPVFNRG